MPGGCCAVVACQHPPGPPDLAQTATDARQLLHSGGAVRSNAALSCMEVGENTRTSEKESQTMK